jgi:hypothetical protein
MDQMCPKCKSPMTKAFSTVSGNSKYMTYECEVCNHKEMKCTGVLK